MAPANALIALIRAVWTQTTLSSMPGFCVPGAGPGGAGGAATLTQLLNAEVLLFGSVAVAAMNWPGGTTRANVNVKVAVPKLLVVTVLDPKNCLPSPKPDGLLTGLAKNSNVNEVFGVLWSSPPTMVVLPADVAD